MRMMTFGLALLLAVSEPLSALAGPDAALDSRQGSLYQTVAGLDAQFFGTFNHCDVPLQLQRHADLMDPRIEFYHDTGGVSWTRQAYLAKTQRNVCGHFRRQLVAGSLEVYPIKDFGAIEEGEQTFCQIDTGKCTGEARFLILWHHSGSSWLITRVFSYGHHSIS